MNPVPMHYAPRTIAFLAEVTHPLANPDPALIQRVHNHLFQATDPAYRSFSVTPTGAVLSNPVRGPARTGAGGLACGLGVERGAQVTAHPRLALRARPRFFAPRTRLARHANIERSAG